MCDTQCIPERFKHGTHACIDLRGVCCESGIDSQVGDAAIEDIASGIPNWSGNRHTAIGWSNL